MANDKPHRRAGPNPSSRPHDQRASSRSSNGVKASNENNQRPKNLKQNKQRPNDSRPKNAGPARAMSTRPPPRMSHPLPERMPPHEMNNRRPAESQMYTFGSGDSYRPRQSNGSSLPERPSGARMQFTFDRAPAGPRFGGDLRNGQPSHRRGRQQQGDRRRRFGKVAPHDRPIIRALNGRAATPERLAGMTDGTITFRSLDELSESMSESESDADGQEPSKRRKLDDSDTPKPAWSNPDPYTAIPPAFEPDRKKTDVVQFIRKAKVIQSQDSPSTNAIAENVDFVSLAFSDDEGDEEPPFSPAPVAGPAPSSKPVIQISTNVQKMSTLPRSSNVLEQADASFSLPPRPPMSDIPLPTISHSSSRKRKLERVGDITAAWVASGALATPWKAQQYPYTADMTWRLHEEILDFHSWVKPVACESRIREHLVTRVEDVLCRSFRDCRLRAFGSFASGLYLPTGDMDLVLVSREYEQSGRPAMSVSKSQMRRALNDLTRADIARGSGSLIIASAKVPIIKFVDKSSELKVDISFENLSGVTANGTYTLWKSQFPDLPYLVAIIKQFLLMRELNEVFNGGLGGFSITCMVVSFLQMDTNAEAGPNPPARNLGQVLIDFFDFYGKKFNMKTTQISFQPVGHFPKTVKVSLCEHLCKSRISTSSSNFDAFSQSKSDPPLTSAQLVGRHKRPEISREKWCIVDPNNPDNDISAGTTMAPLIANKFSEAADALRATMAMIGAFPAGDQERQTILGCIIGGNYESFRLQRERMDRLDEYYMSRR